MRALLFSAIFIGCGGSVADPIDGSSAGDATTDQPSDNVVVDSPQLDAPVDCKAMEAKLASMRAQLLTCCPFCNSQQCNHVTQDVCCPISTTATNVSEFEALVKEYRSQCSVGCPAIPCMMVPSNTCIPGSNPNAPGTCK